VVEGSAWPAADCTSSKLAPFSNAVVINVARIDGPSIPDSSNVSCILAQRAVNHVRVQGPTCLKAFAMVADWPETHSLEFSGKISNR